MRRDYEFNLLLNMNTDASQVSFRCGEAIRFGRMCCVSARVDYYPTSAANVDNYAFTIPRAK